jgi:hypothetical protein
METTPPAVPSTTSLQASTANSSHLRSSIWRWGLLFGTVVCILAVWFLDSGSVLALSVVLTCVAAGLAYLYGRSESGAESKR